MIAGSMRVGFIGLGAMGRPVAQHLMRRGGHTLTVFARRQEVRDTLATDGFQIAHTPSDVAAASDVLFTMVTATADVEQVLFSPDGIAAGAQPGRLVGDMS